MEVARRIGAEIISIDSMQIYRGMNVGTAKPTLVERKGVAHHMIDVADPADEFSAAEFRRRARRVVADAVCPLIITGGSGLHFRAVVDPMSFAPTDADVRAEVEGTSLELLVDELRDADEYVEKVVDLANTRRVVRAVEVLRLTGETPSQRRDSAEAGKIRDYVPEIEFTAFGVDPGSGLDARIGRRLSEMHAGGLIEEVAGLQHRLGRTARSAVGYAEVLDHLNGRMTVDETLTAIGQSTRRLARRQRTWFQRDPRIRWIPWIEDVSDRVERIMEMLS